MADFDDLINTVRVAIQEDPTITDPTKIMVSARKEGPIFRKQTVVQLDGAVKNPAEINKIGDIAARKAPNARIENNLTPPQE